MNYEDCYMASKSKTGLALRKAEGFKNVFVNDWKKNFFKDGKKRIASIPFLRNLIEFSKGDTEPDYLKLTSLLHWKADTESIKECDLDAIYECVCQAKGSFATPTARVVDHILSEAQDCLKAPQGPNFENKIVLSVAIRLVVERYMEKEIADQAFVDAIKDKQTSALLAHFAKRVPQKTKQMGTI